MKVLLTVLMVLLCISLSGATYYVATTGNDESAGTISAPWATWMKGFKTANAGDTVYFRGGVWYPTTTYSGNNITMIAPKEARPIGHSGNAANPICYFNYPGETPILDCSLVDTVGHNFNTAINIIAADFLKWKGLTIRNVWQTHSGNISVGWMNYSCSNITYENCVVYNIGGRGWNYLGSNGYFGIEYDTTTWINCDAYNINDSLSAEPGNAGDGWKIDNEKDAYFYFEGCRAWNCSDDGIDISGSALSIIDNCWSFLNGGADAYDGNGFKFGAVRDSISFPARIVKNCLAAFNSGSGLYDLEYADYYRNNSRVFNNTIYKNKIGIQISNNAPKPNSLSVYKNNIIYGTRSTDAGGRPYNLDVIDLYSESHNTWDYGVPGSLPRWIPTDTITVTDADFVLTDSTSAIAEMIAARKADNSLPDITFLTLASTSDLIGAGTPVGVSYDGDDHPWSASPSIGAFEYNSGTPPAAIPVYISSVIENSAPNRLEMTYSLSLAQIIPASGTFSVLVNSITINVSAISFSGTEVLLTPANPVPRTGNTVDVSLTKILLIPANPVPRTGKPIDVSVTKVLLTLATPVVFGDVVTVAYTRPPTNMLQTNSGGQAATISAKPVINNCIASTNIPPVVTISLQAKSISYIAPVDISINADAYDTDGSIYKVEFFNGIVKIGETTTIPCSIVWKNVIAGTYSLTAVATDNLNSATTSSVIEVEVSGIIPEELVKSVIDADKLYLSLYPNPNNGRFTIEILPSLKNERNIITIVNSTGKTVYKGNLSHEESIMQYDISDLDSGIYILMITTYKIIFTKKFIKT